MANQQLDDCLTTQQAADVMGLTRIRIWQMIQSQELKAEKLGRMFVIRKKDLDSLIKDRKEN